MTRRTDDIFNAVLSGMPKDERRETPSGAARFLKRENAISERLSGQREEKTLLLVDPAECRMWERHNRDYGLLTEETCRDLIDGIRSQGRQEFPAIVRRTGDAAQPYEVICGARRHFAISWLRANNFPQFRYLIEVRDLTDEEAFRLADIENRDREDISDYERASDYARACDLYYGGRQKAMAERLQVTEVWLSRYLELARLPQVIVDAFPSIRDMKELHARQLKPLLKGGAGREVVLAVAAEMAKTQGAARAGQGAYIDAGAVMAELKRAGSVAVKPRAKTKGKGKPLGAGTVVYRKVAGRYVIEFDETETIQNLEAAFEELTRSVFPRDKTRYIK